MSVMTSMIVYGVRETEKAPIEKGGMFGHRKKNLVGQKKMKKLLESGVDAPNTHYDIWFLQDRVLTNPTTHVPYRP